MLSACGSNSGGSGGGGGGGGGSQPTIVTVKFTGATPTAVATRIGTGPFAAATLSGSALTLSVPNGTANFAVAYVCPAETIPPGGTQQPISQYLVEATTADGTSYSFPCPYQVSAGSQTGILTASVDASAISGANLFYVGAVNGTNSGSGSAGTPVANFSFTAPAGIDRVVVQAYDFVLNGNVGSFSLMAAKNFSAQAVPGALNGGNTVVLGAGDETTAETISYSGVPSGFSAPTTLVGYLFAGGGGLLLADAAAAQYPALPSGAMQSGDYYTFTSSSYGPSGSGVAVAKTSNSAGPLSVDFPAAWTYAGPAPAALPAFDLSYSGFPGNTGVFDQVDLTWMPTTTTAYVFEVTATGNSMNGSTTLTFPDLSGLTGFPASPASETSVFWEAEVAQGNYPSLQSIPSNGTVAIVFNAGVYTVP